VKKKTMIIGIAIFLILIITIIIVLIVKNQNSYTVNPDFEADTQMGIHYGGDFNEFDTSVADEEERELQKQAEEKRETFKKEVEEGKREFLESKKDIVIDENGVEIEGASKEQIGKIEVVVSDEAPEIELNEEGEYEVASPSFATSGYSKNEVLCEADTMAEAEEVAAQIKGVLLSYENGLATIQIEGDVDELLADLESKGSELVLYRKYNYTLQ